MLAACEDFSRELGFQFSPNKCEIVGPADAEGYRDCGLYGQRLKSGQSFVYLGVTFSLSGIDSINLMRLIGCHGWGFATSVRRRIYETFVRPKLNAMWQARVDHGFMIRREARQEHARHKVGNTARHFCMTAIRGSHENVRL